MNMMKNAKMLSRLASGMMVKVIKDVFMTQVLKYAFISCILCESM